MAKQNGFGIIGWLVVIVILGGIAGGGYWYWKQHAESAPDFKFAEVTRGDIIQMVTATGQLNPRTNVDVGSQVSGIISHLYADFNSEVTNGQVIAQLDPATYQAIVAGAKADLANAKASLELAEAQAKREQALFDSKIVAQADNDTTTAALHQAQAQVMQKEAALQQADVNLAYTTIYAPVNGVVISRNVDVGQTVAASLSAPTLYMIANDLAQMQIDALVSEADIGGVATNQQVNFTVDAFPTRTFKGVVIQIRNAPQTNQNVITYDTVIEVNNKDLKLRPGMTANVSIITAQQTNVLKIPNGVLRFHPTDPNEVKKEGGTNSAMAQNGTNSNHGDHAGHGGDSAKHAKGDHPMRTVYIPGKGTNNSDVVTAVPVQIKTGISDAVFTQVLEGLKEGDQVIISQTISAAAQNAGSNPFSGGGRRF